MMILAAKSPDHSELAKKGALLVHIEAVAVLGGVVVVLEKEPGL